MPPRFADRDDEARNHARRSTLPIFNLEPPPGSVAQFGVLAIVAPMVMDASVRSDGDYGLRMTMHNLPQLLPVAGGVMTLWEFRPPRLTTPCAALAWNSAASPTASARPVFHASRC